MCSAQCIAGSGSERARNHELELGSLQREQLGSLSAGGSRQARPPRERESMPPSPCGSRRAAATTLGLPRNGSDSSRKVSSSTAVRAPSAAAPSRRRPSAATGRMPVLLISSIRATPAGVSPTRRRRRKRRLCGSSCRLAGTAGQLTRGWSGPLAAGEQMPVEPAADQRGEGPQGRRRLKVLCPVTRSASRGLL